MCDITTVPQEEKRLSNHEYQKQQVDQRGRSGTYQSPTNIYNQGRIRKCGIMQHHQDQDAPRSGARHIQDLGAKSPNVRKWKTQSVPTDDKELQDHNLQGGNHFRYQKTPITTYCVTQGSSNITSQLIKSS